MSSNLGPIARISALFVLSAALTGCYSMLQHPVVDDQDRMYRPDQAHNCASCHNTGAEEGNFRAPLIFSPGIQSGGYSYFSDYPWWWAEPATLKYVVADSSRALPPDSSARASTNSGLFNVFQRARTISPADGSSSGDGGEVNEDDDGKKKKKKSKTMKRRRR